MSSADSPTLDSELFETLRIEERARARISGAVDADGLAHWFGQQLRDAYQSGLRDGRHDRHREQEES